MTHASGRYAKVFFMTDSPKTFTQIVVNGREVSLDKVPEFLRQFVVDADKNGIPDFLDQMFKNPLLKMVAGKIGDQLKSRLQNAKNLTPEQKERLKDVLEKLGAAGNAGTSFSVTTTTSTSSFPPSSSTPLIDYKKLGIPDPEQKRFFLSPLVIVLLGGLIAIAVWVWMSGQL